MTPKEQANKIYYTLVVQNGSITEHKCMPTWQDMIKECKKYGLDLSNVKDEPTRLEIRL